MTRAEWLRGISMRVQNLRERIAATDEECLLGEEESELQCLERKLETRTGGSGRGRSLSQ